MSDQDIMSDSVEVQQPADQDMEFQDSDSLFGDDDPDTTMPEQPNNEETEVSQDSKSTQVPAPESAEDDAADSTVHELDGDEEPETQHTESSQGNEEPETQHTESSQGTAAREEHMGNPDDYTNPKPVQQEVSQTFEEELGLEPGSFDPPQADSNMGDPGQESQESNDIPMEDANAGHPSVDSSSVTHGHGHDEVLQDEQSDAQQQKNSNFQQAHVQDEPLENDSNSLFVPERSSPAPIAPGSRDHPMNMPPPSHPSVHPSKPVMSVFDKIVRMQKANLAKKNAAQKQAATRHLPTDVTPEGYLEGIMSSITPPASTPRPVVDEAEMEDRQALAEYQRQMRHYNELKRKNGVLSFRQDVELLKIRSAETARKRKRARDIEKSNEDAEEEPALFPEAFPTPNVDDGDKDDASEDEFDLETTATRKRPRQQMPHKAPKEQTMQEAELQSMKVALDAHEDLPKKKRKIQPTDDNSQDSRASTKGKGSKAKAKPKATKAAPKSAARGPRKTAKSKKEADHAIKQASSLFHANVFVQQAGADEPDQPGFNSRRKGDALKELIASVPLADKKQARSEMALLLQATKDFDGHGSVKAAGGNWLVKGMSTSLKGYQLMGGAFMRRRENAVDEPRGGLLADQMGLGKTLMMLANIVNGQPRKGHHPRTTLLVASPSLLAQWGREITQHTACGLKVMRYGSGNRLDSTNASDILRSHDIVLTTYSEVMKSYPKNEPPIECQTAEQKIAWWKDVYEKERGMLHKTQFLRIVLDEAQAIKNHQGRTSIACRALIARHKWALSGTPILNSLTELYPYFKFLGVPHTGSFKIFKNNYCNSKNAENTERLLVRLSQFMLRRTHADRMFNAPILKLPMAGQGTYYCEFNPIERCIYDIVQQRFAKRINMWQAKDQLNKSYSNVLVMLLRLRQLTAHVLMLQFVMRDLLEIEDIQAIKNVVAEQSVDGTTPRGRTIIAVRKQLEKHAIDVKKKAAADAKKKATAAAARTAAEAAGKVYEVEEDETEEEELSEPEEASGQPTAQEGAGLGGSGRDFGKSYNFKPYLSSLKVGESWDTAKKRAKCSWCDKTPKDPWITDCGHLICLKCNDLSNLAAAEQGNEHAPCKTCGSTPKTCQPCDMDDMNPVEAVAEGTRSKKSKAKKREQPQDREDISEDWLSMAGAEVLPSAKTLAIKAQILNWMKEDPKVKIIIYTQFLAMVKILGKICSHEGWEAEQYVGTMSFGARDKAINTFASNDKCNILLASLRCGGLGLNLTMASRVIMVDPWWNEASEQQAFCRVFRIGQKEETFMSRLCVKNTVDSKLIEMQERKTKEIGEIMEDNGDRMKKMGTRDLMRLFGNTNEDAEGKPFILVDDPDPRGGFRADQDDEGYADEF
ncbi:hypothetical protein HBH64_080990 [Parastagonospora nodorum]|nr:hypothetical protein HBI01_160060 [Parastagonospora nodorum]KAH4307766.1 hypothetical protein HBI02_111470 [Parastagonospora nodorum]KAH4325239.1 hypothetical protein HBI00_154480 [Parastagonospora nodorum]KAH4363796.1 hypothetical protein HBH94_168880 [Parastagonospora nodorum]KAH4459571.1 hypothetical protein HBH90_145720 [Parastagonospora nodorum]